MGFFIFQSAMGETSSIEMVGLWQFKSEKILGRVVGFWQD
jgi:hypothetical protein